MSKDPWLCELVIHAHHGVSSEVRLFKVEVPPVCRRVGYLAPVGSG